MKIKLAFLFLLALAVFYFYPHIQSFILINFVLQDSKERLNTELVERDLSNDGNYYNVSDILDAEIDFAVPWVNFSRIDEGASSKIYVFEDNKRVLVFQESRLNNIDSVMSLEEENSYVENPEFQDKLKNDPFSIEKDIYASRVNQLGLFTSRQKAKDLYFNLPLKDGSSFEKDVSYFSNAYIKGFAYTLSSQHGSILVQFYDQNNVSRELIISGYDSDEEVNFIINSIRVK